MMDLPCWRAPKVTYVYILRRVQCKARFVLFAVHQLPNRQEHALCRPIVAIVIVVANPVTDGRPLHPLPIAGLLGLQGLMSCEPWSVGAGIGTRHAMGRGQKKPGVSRTAASIGTYLGFGVRIDGLA